MNKLDLNINYNKLKIEETLDKLAKEMIAGTIETERFQEFGKILTQKESEDTQEEATIREILMNYNTLPTLGIEYVKMMTNPYFEKAPITPQILIETDPTNADIYIDGKYSGTSPVTKEMEAGVHSIEARINGYKTNTLIKMIEPQTKDQKTIETLRIELEKETGSLSIRTTPSDASIYINNHYKGTSPQTIEGLEEGTYHLTVIKDDYEENSETVDIQAGKTMDIEIKLVKQQEEPVTINKQGETGIGYLKIERDIGKKYSIDGESKGWIVPKEIKLQVGTHTIEIQGIGEIEIEIKDDELTVINNNTEFEREDRTPKLETFYMVDWEGNRKSEFDEHDSGVAYAFLFSNWVDTHDIYGKWYKPDGSLYKQGKTFTYEKKSDGIFGRKWIGYEFETKESVLNAMKANPGRWKVALYLDDKYLDTVYFTFKSKNLMITSEKKVTSAKLVSLHMSDWQGYDKSEFSINDTGVAFTFEFSGWNEKRTINCQWYKPTGELYATWGIGYEKQADGYLGRKVMGYNFSNQDHYDTLQVLRSNPGMWRVVVYLDDTYLRTLYFTFKRY